MPYKPGLLSGADIVALDAQEFYSDAIDTLIGEELHGLCASSAK